MNNIKHIRTQQNLAAQDLANFLGCSKSAVGHYENGRRIPDLDTSRKIVTFFNSKGVAATLDSVFPPVKQGA